MVRLELEVTLSVLMNLDQLSFALSTVQHGHGGKSQTVSLRPTVDQTGFDTSWRFMMFIKTCSGDMFGAVNVGKRRLKSCSGCVDVTPRTNRFFWFWIISLPINGKRCAVGHARTWSHWSGHRPTLRGSTESSANLRN